MTIYALLDHRRHPPEDICQGLHIRRRGRGRQEEGGFCLRRHGNVGTSDQRQSPRRSPSIIPRLKLSFRVIDARSSFDFVAGVYNDQNLALSATHTHSGAGGYMQYFLFLATSFGFVEDSYAAAKNGIVEAISMAHNNMQGSCYHDFGDLFA